ncbi:hypothetical protein EDB92DRAFT_1814910 [Lactarius akahatsu]|uniref:Uncharacterized protein n=1 Tax=Lactarius akahatsu TaxID=416441 RepID=A0AAD4LQ55_9AGAM|nr:hypothetical protein EDB92DRAFT_1814910 [Lactarius akahatsu]
MTDNHKGPLRPEGEDLLQAALADPFSVSNLPRVSPFQPTNPATAEAAPPEPSEPLAPTSPESSVSPAEFEAWKAEYESQVAEWRRQNATARTRAEAERARWEERRAHEEQQQGGAERRDTHVSEASVELGGTGTSASEWEAVSHRSTPAPSDGHPTPVPPARGGPAEGAHHPHPQPPSADAQTAHRLPAAAGAVVDPTGSPNWENVPSSPTSSFPSMSFPEPSRPHSPEHTTHVSRVAAPAPAPPAAASATLAVFDDTLPTRKRVLALITSLSVNMLLPFVNGVMLGFGEIFAKTVVVGWLGWGPAVANECGTWCPFS